MDKDFLVQLTKKFYHLTVLFPKKEPLRYKMRELALEILQKPDEQDFETLNSFFEVAKAQNWVKPDDILAIQIEYANLSRETVNPKQEKLFGAMDQLATSWVLGKRGYRLTDAAEPVATIFLKGVCTDGV